MRRSVSLLAIIAAALVASPVGAQKAPAPTAGLEKQFDAVVSPAEMDGWMKTMAAEPNHVSAPHNKANAEMTLKQFQDWGWDARIETFKVLYPTPLKVSLDLAGKTSFKATLTEKPIPGTPPLARA